MFRPSSLDDDERDSQQSLLVTSSGTEAEADGAALRFAGSWRDLTLGRSRTRTDLFVRRQWRQARITRAAAGCSTCCGGCARTGVDEYARRWRGGIVMAARAQDRCAVRGGHHSDRRPARARFRGLAPDAGIELRALSAAPRRAAAPTSDCVADGSPRLGIEDGAARSSRGPNSSPRPCASQPGARGLACRGASATRSPRTAG